MNVEFTPQALDDLGWFVQHDARLARRIVKLVDEIRRDPFSGIGKPEALRGDLAGWWSRRIDAEHRLVYRVVSDGPVTRVQVAQCRYHY